MSVSSPSSTISGHYDSDGTPKAFADTLRGSANTDCGYGWSSIEFRITGPGDFDDTFPVSSPPGSGGTWTGNASSAWNTLGRLNGEYTVRLNAKEKNVAQKSLLDGQDDKCNGQIGTVSRKVNVANAAVTPEWAAAPAAAGDGSPAVSLKWKKNAEEDIISYEITRSGADGTITALVPPTACGTSTCQAQDGPNSFPAEYSGSYSYKIVAVRSAPDGTGEACGSARCVKSNASEIKSVTLTKPTPSPSPTDSPGGSPTARPGGGSTGGGSSSSNGSRSTRVLSFGGGGSGGGSSYNDFYSGTYKEQLPYQPKTLVIGNGKTTSPSDGRNEAAAFSEDPPNYRTIMLPVAGGLLAFLSAAHVRRLLIHF